MTVSGYPMSSSSFFVFSGLTIFEPLDLPMRLVKGFFKNFQVWILRLNIFFQRLNTLAPVCCSFDFFSFIDLTVTGNDYVGVLVNVDYTQLCRNQLIFCRKFEFSVSGTLTHCSEHLNTFSRRATKEDWFEGS